MLLLQKLLLAVTSAVHAAPEDPPTIGLAYTGGGIPGILQALCTHEALSDVVPSFEDLQLTVSSVSGGSLGYLLHRSAANLQYPPALTSNLTYEVLSSKNTSPGSIWWANVLSWLPDQMGKVRNSALRGLRSGGPDPQKGWWQDVIAGLFRVGYGVPSGKEGGRGMGHFIQGFSAVERKGCLPMQRDEMGFMLNAEKCLHIASLETKPGAAAAQLRVAGGLSFSPVSGSSFTFIDGAAWTSSFYASSIIENPTSYKEELLAEYFNKGVLISTEALKPNSSGTHAVHLIDGGFVDSTGIVAQLQRQTRRILVVYVVNRCLGRFAANNQCENATLATLFGVSTPTDGMDSLAGRHAQVFPSSLYADVYSNLTNGSNLMARLTNVPVLRNGYLEVEPYALEELIILSNAGSESFLDMFSDPDIRKNLDSRWPDRFAFTMDTFNANMMCLLQRWKVRQHAADVRRFFANAVSSSSIMI